MPSSTARREQLVSKVHLILIAVLFAVSFLVFKPARQTFVLKKSDNPGQARETVDDLDLAYLKARASSGTPSADELIVASSALIRSGQHTQAKELLQQYPGIELQDHQRYLLDLELAASDFAAADTDKEVGRAGQQLFNILHLLLDRTELHDVQTLNRATSLSRNLDRADLTEPLYHLLASNDATNAAVHFSDCGDFFAGKSLHEKASQCYRSALNLDQSPADSFDLEIKLLQQVGQLGNPFALDKVIDALVTHEQLTFAQTETLATSLLQVGRPDAAHPLFAKLAAADKDNAGVWWGKAARWAEASGRPDFAVIYLENQVRVTPKTQRAGLDEKLHGLLIATGQNDAALDLVLQRIENSPADAMALSEGIELALQLGKHDVAAVWNARLLELQPDNQQAINRQVDISLATKDLKSAQIWVQRAIAANPADRELRLRLARVTEWSGNPVEAQKHWEWLAANHPDENSLREVIRLAEMNFMPASAAHALLQLAKMSPPDAELTSKLIKHYELEGRPDKARKALEEIIGKHGATASLLQELANLNYRHSRYQLALQDWQRFIASFGRTTKAGLMVAELHWRLNETEKAASVAKQLLDEPIVSEASPYQVKLLAEIAWRYRIPQLAIQLKSRVDGEANDSEKSVYGTRLISSLAETGEPALAAAQAREYWRDTGDQSFALKAMSLALTGDSNPDAVAVSDNFLQKNDENVELRKMPAYWSLSAQTHLKRGDTELAVDAYETALTLDPDNIEAISGLLWAYIGDGDTQQIGQLLEKHEETAEVQSQLWSAYAIGYLRMGAARQSLVWFDRLVDTMEADYGMLLSYADALEVSGRADHAVKVRRFAVQRLRPLLAKGISEEQDALIQQYAGLLSRYADADTNEQWARYLLESADDQAATSAGAQDTFWREDIAISWLMSTQRHEHARLVMSRIHDRRIKDPAWQQVALAMQADDVKTLDTLLAQNTQLSVGNHILALRQLGRDREAYTLSVKGMQNAPSLSDQNISEQQYIYLRGERPSYSSATAKQTSLGKLSINEAGFKLRHTFAARDTGIEVAYNHQTLKSDEYLVNGQAARSDLSLSLFFGDAKSGGNVTTGVLAVATGDTIYGSGRYHLQNRKGTRQWFAELAYNEAATQSAELRVAGKQHRVSAGLNSSLGAREFINLQVDATDISTRIDEMKVARGLSARGELGIRGAVGSNAWSTSLVGSHATYKREASLPAELLLSQSSSINSAIAPKNTVLSLAASLSRGGVNTDFPATTSPRYYINGNLGHSWPAKSFGLQFEAGAGIRVLGGDELSFALSHDALAKQVASGDSNSTTFGLNYKYHFRH